MQLMNQKDGVEGRKTEGKGFNRKGRRDREEDQRPKLFFSPENTRTKTILTGMKGMDGIRKNRQWLVVNHPWSIVLGKSLDSGFYPLNPVDPCKLVFCFSQRSLRSRRLKSFKSLTNNRFIFRLQRRNLDGRRFIKLSCISCLDLIELSQKLIRNWSHWWRFNP